jgi:hypothetical protein
MAPILAIKAKVEFTVLTFTRVFRFLNVGEGATSFHGTPTHVIHLRDGVVNRKLLILVN